MRNLSVLAPVLLCAALAFAAEPVAKNLSCAACHAKQAATQPGTSMAHALIPVSDNPLFQTHPKLKAQKGAYSYSIETRGGQSTYTVSDGKDTISVPIHWVFGAGSQTYVLERNGVFYESLLSYYTSIDGLDTTMGDQSVQPKNVLEAFGRPLAASEVTLCFGCHSSESVVDHRLHFESLTPGVTCLHCHAGAELHLQGISRGKLDSVPPKLKQRSPEEISSFCGQCHRSWETVVRNHWMGPINVRFQPYRLANSKCFDGSDRRLSCIACHDPHRKVVRDSKSYDKSCLACHASGAKLSLGLTAAHPGAKTMPVCRVSKTDCTSCHMPAVQLPGGHQVFHDHDIRIAHADEPYPN